MIPITVRSIPISKLMPTSDNDIEAASESTEVKSNKVRWQYVMMYVKTSFLSRNFFLCLLQSQTAPTWVFHRPF